MPRTRNDSISALGIGLLWSLVTGLLISGGILAYIRQGPEPVTVDAAVEQFRATKADTGETTETTSRGSAETRPGTGGGPPGSAADAGPTSAAPPSRTPAPGAAPGAPPSKPAVTSGPRGAEGVYPHKTEGFEQTDAVGGARHEYPSESSVVVRHTDCGLITRWQPLKERWDESSFCSVGSALEIRSFSMYHEFFQKGQQDDYRCPPGSIVFDRQEPVGASWMWHCDSENASVDTQTRVVGVEPLTIDGRRIDAVRMRYESRLSGATEGAQLQERWIDPASGMVLRLRSEVAAKTDSPFGRVNYEEKYLIEIKSLTPRT